MQCASRGFYLTVLRLRRDGPKSRLVVVLTVQVSSGMSSKQTQVLLKGGRGAAGFSKFLFTPLFWVRVRDSDLLPFLRYVFTSFLLCL